MIKQNRTQTTEMCFFLDEFSVRKEIVLVC